MRGPLHTLHENEDGKRILRHLQSAHHHLPVSSLHLQVMEDEAESVKEESSPNPVVPVSVESTAKDDQLEQSTKKPASVSTPSVGSVPEGSSSHLSPVLVGDSEVGKNTPDIDPPVSCTQCVQTSESVANQTTREGSAPPTCEEILRPPHRLLLPPLGEFNINNTTETAAMDFLRDSMRDVYVEGPRLFSQAKE